MYSSDHSFLCGVWLFSGELDCDVVIIVDAT